jgi:hypothetical protein
MASASSTMSSSSTKPAIERGQSICGRHAKNWGRCSSSSGKSVLGEIERGNLRVWTRIEDIEPIIKRLERVVERSNASILASACIVGLAMVMLFYRLQGWQAWIGAVFWVAVGIALIRAVRTFWLRK